MATGKGDIELAGVYKRFGDVAAVDGVNLKIPDGAYCCFLGPIGLRQDHHPAHDRRPRRPDRRRDSDRRRQRASDCRRSSAARR